MKKSLPFALVFICLFVVNNLNAKTSKRIIFKLKSNVSYQVDKSNKRLLALGIDAIPEMQRLEKLQSLYRQNSKAAKPLAKLELIKNIHFATLNEKDNIDAVIKKLKATGIFEYVEKDGSGSGSGISPNDEYYTDPTNYQWALKNTGVFTDSATVGADIKMEDAWGITTGSESIIVCVLDSGIKLDHPEFSGRIWVNEDEIPGNNIDDDGNGIIDDVNGYNFAYGNSDLTDDVGHGCNVAGILCANGNDGYGIAGINWKCKLMNCKILDNNNSGYYSWWIDGIYYAIEKGAKVINMSVGGSDVSQAMKDACDFAKANNVIITACMQNFNTSTVYYPAGYESVIAVGATSTNDKRTVPFPWSSTSGSNYGPHIDLVAPGNLIPGPAPEDDVTYYLWAGTSQATPMVAGTVSLMLSLNPTLTFDEIRTTLMATADDQVGDPTEDVAGFDNYYGAGRLNAYKALQSVVMSLHFISFTAQKQSNGVLLKWSTENEINTDNFIAERSTNGRTFDVLGTVISANKPGVHNYSFNDLKPGSTNYYRLKQIDKDGKFNYSATITIAYSKNGAVVVMPNPVKDNTTILLDHAANNAKITLYNLTGKRVLVQNSTGNATIHLNMQHLPAGTYVMKLEEAGKTYQQKIIKQ